MLNVVMLTVIMVHVFMLSVIMLNVITLIVVMLSVIMVHVFMLSVMAPNHLPLRCHFVCNLPIFSNRHRQRRRQNALRSRLRQCNLSDEGKKFILTVRPEDTEDPENLDDGDSTRTAKKMAQKMR